MKKTLFLWLLIAAAFFANSQGKTLYTVNVVKPKSGMKSAFETHWKAHLAMYHKTEDKRTVYEVVSGSHSGEYHIVEGPISYADMDVEKPRAKEHGMDLEKNFSPYLENGSTNATYRHDDTASMNGSVAAEKFQVTVTHLKMGTQQGTIREMRRSSLLNAKMNVNPTFRFSANTYFQILQGTKSVIVQVRNLKDGFKELDGNYFPRNPNPPAPTLFKDTYIKDYGQEAWDARSKLLDDNANIESRESFLMILRKDLSSQ
ncbi:MAG: hypothetical protein IPO53_07945 [Chitinophagaceae bacterium]|nr:hypothetical protein [Chitinophagaceae bacterium]